MNYEYISQSREKNFTLNNLLKEEFVILYFDKKNFAVI